MKYARSLKFNKRHQRLSKEMRERVDVRLLLFVQNPHDPLLDNHLLKGKHAGLRSINISGDLRAIYQPVSADAVYFIDLGTHHELYGS